MFVIILTTGIYMSAIGVAYKLTFDAEWNPLDLVCVSGL